MSVYRRVSCESAESPVTAVTDVSVDGKTFVVATQWNKIRTWAVSSHGYLTFSNSVHG